MTAAYRSFAVPVGDGELAVGEWAAGERPVLAIHGISSTHLLWLWTAASLDGHRLVAPDLRHRGASQDLPRKSGIAAHRDDVLRILDHLGWDRLTLVGMSLGGFIAAAVADAQPERIERLVLVDGGIPFASAAAMRQASREQVVESLRDRFARIERRWTSFEEYRDFFLGATAPLLDPADPLLERYLRYDLAGEPPELRVRLDGEAMAGDAADLFFNDEAARVAESIQVPATLLYAEWTSGEGTPPAYPAGYLRPWEERLPNLRTVFLPGTDHAATVMTPASGAAIARAIASGG